MHIVAILNRDGGTLRTMDLAALAGQAVEIFRRNGHDLECRIVAGRNVETELRRVAGTRGVDVMLVGGGDGTISTAAGIAFETGVPLAILPAGTMNLFARALQLPLDLTAAMEAIADGEIAAVDIATANGRVFVHQFGVGVHARLVRIRERMTYRSRIGKMLASLRAIAEAVLHPPEFEAEIHTRNGSERQRVSGIAVSNNPVGDGHIPYADRLDAGLLGVYMAAPMSTWALIRLAVDVLLGKWRASDAVTEQEVEQVTLSFPWRKHDAHAVIDGELIKLAPSVTLKVHPGALKVLLPKPPETGGS
ncbi:Transcription regulator (Contains diacylglycerol kinase catalytic domain) [Devosia sp. LC5]|uniref:diacylglycerol/lipid kinase family protein n=1 Tax=Devosia sp. LC5 TaxID=1502724 RepID=UPI0004E40415|nr:diacylglycerol kinase family protein [Devosia sp. LC5]KFC62526.1 Transcription regulator (Contains diacylglycerol kinase catalytic domain) [Devosia sp. LC5]